MALTKDKLPNAVASVMAGISEGVLSARDVVDSVKFPEAVQFEGDFVLGVNAFPSVVTRTDKGREIRERASKVSYSRKRFVGSDLREHVSWEDPESETVTRESPVVKETKTFEDEAIGFSFAYLGPQQE